MSKITFRADDDLVEELESLEASKSEAMREALRAYLGASDEQSVSDTGAGSDANANSEPTREHSGEPAIDDIVRKHVDDLLTERLAEFERERERGRRHDRHPTRAHASETQDVNVTIALEGTEARRVDEDAHSAPSGEPDHTPDRARNQTAGHERDRGTTCGQCGEDVDGDHVYCPNCGEKASRRSFCECGDELRSDWAFCPSCGRRTASADVLESNSRNP